MHAISTAPQAAPTALSRMPRRLLVLAAAGALALPALAIEKCVDAAGRVTFTDSPCPTGQKKQALKLHLPKATSETDGTQENATAADDQYTDPNDDTSDCAQLDTCPATVEQDEETPPPAYHRPAKKAKKARNAVTPSENE